MKTTDWQFDFASLPRWDNREKFCWVRDAYFELPESDTLCCLYSICEVSMMNEVGFLAILKDKKNPRLVLNVAEEFNFCVNFSASADGNLIFLQPSIYDSLTNQCHRPILILDLQKNRFSFVKTANSCTLYRVVQKKKNVFIVEADARQRKHNPHLAALHGKKIRTRWLRWYAMDQLPTLLQKVK